MDIMIKYSYDGSNFYGLQKQKKEITIQGEIERVLKHSFKEDICLISSGRTDTKVHALGQVSNFSIKKNIPLEAIKNQINKDLFGKVNVYEIKEVDKTFHSRFSAKVRVYEYRFKHFKDITPFEYNYVSAVKKKIDLDKINENLKLFIGVHDFLSYSKKDIEKNTVREIYDAYCYKENDTYIAIIKGSAFLKSMIRLMMASSILEDKELIKRRLNLELLDLPKKILSPNGLYLKEVIYDTDN